jgi:hypothetical protein
LKGFFLGGWGWFLPPNFFSSYGCFAFIYGVFILSFPPLLVLGLAFVYFSPPFSNVVASTNYQDGLTSSLGSKNGAHHDVSGSECSAFFYGMACLVINDIVKLFTFFLLGVPLALLLPFLPFLPFLQLGR